MVKSVPNNAVTNCVLTSKTVPVGIKSEYDLRIVQELIRERDKLIGALGRIGNTIFGDDLYIGNAANEEYGSVFAVPVFLVRWIEDGLTAKIDEIKSILQNTYGLSQ